jgi:formate/nitrite transporter FocA (FNT family)
MSAPDVVMRRLSASDVVVLLLVAAFIVTCCVLAFVSSGTTRLIANLLMVLSGMVTLLWVYWRNNRSANRS